MAGALGLTGWYFGSKPTTATSQETVVHPAKGGMPWHTDDQDANFKYKYHPYGDERNDPKEAPSALHSVIVPNVNLPKVCYLFFCVLVEVVEEGRGDRSWE